MTRRFPIGLTIASLIAFAILVGLGVWQLQRLAWKEDLLAKREALLTAQPRPLADVVRGIRNADDLDMVRVQVTCPGLDRAPYETLYGMAQGQMVYRLVSPCPLQGLAYDAVLVDRGYVLDTVTERPGVAPDTYPVQVTGLLLAPEGKKGLTTTLRLRALPPPKPGQPKLWFGRDLTGMAQALGVKNPVPLFLVAETSSNPDWKPLKPGLPPVIIPNRHMEYALTWFGLAGALACVYAAMLWRQRKGQ